MTSTAMEIERKYIVPDEFVLSDLAAGDTPTIDHLTGPVHVDLDATYYDTDDLRLAGQGMTLRRREGGDDAGWHLKRPADAGKTETREPLGEGAEVPASLAYEVRVVTQGAPLTPVARIRTLREETTICDPDGQPLAVIADDAVTADRIVDPPARMVWREIEVELVNGTPETLDVVDGVLRSAGARPATTPSKLAHALGECAADRQHDSGDLDGGAMVIAYLKAQRDALIRNEPLVRAGDVDGVHDMRVASRRARTALRTYGSFLPPDQVAGLYEDLHWLAGLLGAVRDSQVLHARLHRAVKCLPPELVLGPVLARIDERLIGGEATAGAELGDALDSDRTLALMRALGTLVDGPAPEVTLNQVRKCARRALRRADRRLDRAERRRSRASSRSRLPRPGTDSNDGDVALHDARKAYKRARYAVEVLIPAVGRPARRLAKRLGNLQDILGDHQDAVVAAGLMREFGVRVHLDGDNSFTYGLLCADQTDAAEHALENLGRSVRRAAKRGLRRAVVDH